MFLINISFMMDWHLPERATTRLNKLQGTKKWEVRLTYVERQVVATPLTTAKTMACASNW
jgi:hypothetical protein